MTATSPASTARVLPDTTPWRRALTGALSGLLAGLLYGSLLSSQQMSPMLPAADFSPESVPPLLLHLLVSAAIGLVFGLVSGDQISTAGEGVIWGVVVGMMWWMLGPLTLFPLLQGARPDWSMTFARSTFPQLAGLSVTYGAMMGLLFWVLNGLAIHRRAGWLARRGWIHTLQAATSGGLAGLLGGWVFGVWMEQAGFFPLIAGLVNSTDPLTGRWLHFGISILIGVTYGVLFQEETRTLGTSIAWGMGYGLIWWIVGPLTVMPWLLGQGVQWSLLAAQSAFPSLIGHLLYGITLGFVQALLSRVWRLLFVDSDPLMREPEGPGTRNLRALLLGAVASIGGGLAFTVVMVATNALPMVAGLMGMSGDLEGFILHMGISVVIGAAYGVLFRRDAQSPTTALAWGLVYGMVWWVLGPLTLMPALLGAPLAWSVEAVSGAFPSLVGHLLYGVVLALLYHRLLLYYAPRQMSSSRDHHRPSRAAPALWMLIVLLLLLLLLLQV